MKSLLTLTAAALAATVLAASATARHSPAVTDVPSASQSERYVPFVTDFPSNPSSTRNAAPPAAAGNPAGGFDGLDAAFGAAVGLALGALAVASVSPLRRRRSVSSA